MALIAMNWKKDQPPKNLVGFAIEYKEPKGDKFFPLKNRITFPDANGEVDPQTLSIRLSPIQKFRWVHFPRNAELPGEFTYKVTPVFMNEADELSYGEPQSVGIELRRETYPGKLNVTFTRGFVSSQAFVDRYGGVDAIPQLLPSAAAQGFEFVPTHPKAEEALAWMGFEARSAIFEVLDKAIADKTAKVRVVVYDLNEPGIVSRLEKLGTRLKIIIDNEGDHGEPTSAESKAEIRLVKTAGRDNVLRQCMGKLQHNKTVVADGTVQAAVCCSTNHSWRGFYVQNNNAIILRGETAVIVFMKAFEDYWNNSDKVSAFGKTTSAEWNDLKLDGINAQIGFSPRSAKNRVLSTIATDVATNTTSNLFFPLAFLYQTLGDLQDAIKKHKQDNNIRNVSFTCARSPRWKLF
jgi:hypothetical protein